jgi:hypothetical protein
MTLIMETRQETQTRLLNAKKQATSGANGRSFAIFYRAQPTYNPQMDYSLGDRSNKGGGT